MNALFLSLLLFAASARAAIDPVTDAADRREPKNAAIAKAATAHYPKRRALAAHAYGEIMSPAGIGPLFLLLEDPLPFVRAEAAFSLGQLGWLKDAAGGREGEIRRKLAPLQHDKQGMVRAAAVEALGKIGGEETWALASPAFADKDAKTRAAAVMAIFRARMIQKLRDPAKAPGALAPDQRAALENLAADKAPEVRLAVAYFFARNAEPKAEDTVKKLAADREANVRLFAVTALGKMKAKAPLVTAFADKEFPVRVAAVGAAVAGGQPVPEALLSDSSWQVRAAAAAALPESPALRKAFASDPSLTVRAEALKALAKSDKAVLAGAAKSEFWQLREAAAAASDGLGEERAKFLSAMLATEQNGLVRAAILEPLLALPGEATFAQLKTCLVSPGLADRGTAVGALAERKEAEIPALALQTFEASQDPKWVETREDLVAVFEKKGDEMALRKALNDPDRGVRAKAKTALLARGVHDLPKSEEPPFSFSPFRDETFRHNPVVEIETNKGTFRLQCFALDAPIHVADFVGHVKAGFYDGLLWHRVIPNFVAQGGDPDGTGFGGAGYSIRAEINRQPFARGALGMPRSQGFDTGGGQLFFSLVPTPHLEGQYTVFGQVTQGVEVLDRLERGDRIVKARIIQRKIR